MTYRLNTCLLSSTFEKSFGLPNFTRDYTALLGELNAVVDGANIFPYPSSLIEYQDWRSAYRLFCKLSHFFDDFNFFINESMRTRTEHGSKDSVLRRFTDFVRRVESMNIPKNYKTSICKFLEKHRDALTAWLVPRIFSQGDLNISHNKRGLSYFDRTRRELLQQLSP